MAVHACRCGSGLPEARCHAPTAAPSLRLEALAWLHQLGRWFPSLRPHGREFEVFADRAADRLGHSENDVPASWIEDGLALLPERERARVVALFADMHPDQWQAVSADLRDERRGRRALVAGAVRAAIGDRRRPPRRVLEHMEAGIAPAPDARAALMLALDPSGVWDLPDAQAASADGLVPSRIVTVAVGLLEEEHGRRVTRLAQHLERRLPFDDVPRTSELLAEGCRDAIDDDAFASQVAIDLMVTYVAHRFARPPASVN